MPRSLKLYFFGDSIFFGQYMSPQHGFVARTALALETYFCDKHDVSLMVQNPSINGNTTGMALARMTPDIEAHKPDFVAVQFGLNDCNYWLTDGGRPRTDIDQFGENLKEIIRRVRAIPAVPWLHTNHPTGRTRDIFPNTLTTYEQSNQRYSEKIREVAAAENVPLLDVAREAQRYCRDQGIGTRELVLDDLLHLSLRGHVFYTEIVIPFSRDIIEKAL